MIVYEDECVCCDLPCLGKACPYVDIPVHYCDAIEHDGRICKSVANYRIDGEDFCEKHALEYLSDYFNDLTVKEKAESLSLQFKEYEEGIE